MFRALGGKTVIATVECPSPVSKHLALEKGWQRGMDVTSTAGAEEQLEPCETKPAAPRPHHGLVCQVEGCSRRLSREKEYYQRYRVCKHHSTQGSVQLTAGGGPHRFCQQCCCFQPLDAFDGDRRSCRERLALHNNRRRARQEQRGTSSPEATPEPASLRSLSLPATPDTGEALTCASSPKRRRTTCSLRRSSRSSAEEDPSPAERRLSGSAERPLSGGKADPRAAKLRMPKAVSAPQSKDGRMRSEPGQAYDGFAMDSTPTMWEEGHVAGHSEGSFDHFDPFAVEGELRSSSRRSDATHASNASPLASVSSALAAYTQDPPSRPPTRPHHAPKNSWDDFAAVFAQQSSRPVTGLGGPPAKPHHAPKTSWDEFATLLQQGPLQQPPTLQPRAQAPLPRPAHGSKSSWDEFAMMQMAQQRAGRPGHAPNNSWDDFAAAAVPLFEPAAIAQAHSQTQSLPPQLQRQQGNPALRVAAAQGHAYKNSWDEMARQQAPGAAAPAAAAAVPAPIKPMARRGHGKQLSWDLAEALKIDPPSGADQAMILPSEQRYSWDFTDLEMPPPLQTGTSAAAPDAGPAAAPLVKPMNSIPEGTPVNSHPLEHDISTLNLGPSPAASGSPPLSSPPQGTAQTSAQEAQTQQQPPPQAPQQEQRQQLPSKPVVGGSASHPIIATSVPAGFASSTAYPIVTNGIALVVTTGMPEPQHRRAAAAAGAWTPPWLQPPIGICGSAGKQDPALQQLPVVLQLSSSPPAADQGWQ